MNDFLSLALTIGLSISATLQAQEPQPAAKVFFLSETGGGTSGQPVLRVEALTDGSFRISQKPRFDKAWTIASFPDETAFKAEHPKAHEQFARWRQTTQDRIDAVADADSDPETAQAALVEIASWSTVYWLDQAIEREQDESKRARLHSTGQALRETLSARYERHAEQLRASLQSQLQEPVEGLGPIMVSVGGRSITAICVDQTTAVLSHAWTHEIELYRLASDGTVQRTDFADQQAFQAANPELFGRWHEMLDVWNSSR